MEDVSHTLASSLMIVVLTVDHWLKMLFETNWYRVAIVALVLALMSPWVHLWVSRPVAQNLRLAFLIVAGALFLWSMTQTLREARAASR